MNIYLVRHGETTLNGQKRYIGHMDDPISVIGTRQAKAVAGALSSKQIDIIYSSPLIRARETAEEISRTLGNVPIVLLEGLKEVHFGDWEGLSYQEIYANNPDVNNWLLDPARTQIPGGENWFDFEARVVKAFDKVTEAGKNACIVSHGGPLRLIIGKVILPKASLCYIAPGILTINHGSLSLIKKTEDYLSIGFVNEICHLSADRVLTDNFSTKA